MKFSLSFVSSLGAQLQRIFLRFPGACLIALWMSTLSLLVVSRSNAVILTQYIVILGISFFISVGISLISERLSLTRLHNLLSQSITILFWVVLFYYLGKTFFENSESITRFFISLVGAIAFLLSSPYIGDILRKKDSSEEQYYGYIYSIFVIFCTAGLLAGLIWWLGALALVSINLLFGGVNIEGTVYVQWGIISAFLFAPLFWLYQIPGERNSGYSSLLKAPFILFIVRYVLVPFMYVYFCILYAYLIKVLALPGEWPNGRIPWMIIGFSSLGYSVYILSRALSESRMVQIYQRYLPWVVLPQILFLFYAIALRIEQYDLTMNRYLVVAFGLWLTGISLYYVFSREKSIGVIPVSLLVSILLIAGGPWSFQNLAESRQYERFLTNLTTAGILRDGVIYSIDIEKLSNPKLLAAIKSQILTLSSIRNGERLMELRRKVSTEVGQCLRSLSSFPEDKQARLRIHWICVLGEGVNE